MVNSLKDDGIFDCAGQEIQTGDLIVYGVKTVGCGLKLSLVTNYRNEVVEDRWGRRWERRQVCLTSLDAKKLSNRWMDWDRRGAKVSESFLTEEQRQGLDSVRTLMNYERPSMLQSEETIAQCIREMLDRGVSKQTIIELVKERLLDENKHFLDYIEGHNE